MVRGLEVACIHLDLGYCFFGVLMCMFVLLIGLEVAEAKKNKSNHFIGCAMGLFILAGARGANAVCRWASSAGSWRLRTCKHVAAALLVSSWLPLLGTVGRWGHGAASTAGRSWPTREAGGTAVAGVHWQAW